MTPDLRSLTPADRRQVLTALTGIVDQELAAAARHYAALLHDFPPEVQDFVRVWLDLQFATTRAAILDVVRELVLPRRVH